MLGDVCAPRNDTCHFLIVQVDVPLLWPYSVRLCEAFARNAHIQLSLHDNAGKVCLLDLSDSQFFKLSTPAHCRISVLEGGLPAWESGSGPISTEEVPDEQVHAPGKAARNPPEDTRYRAKFDPSKVSWSLWSITRGHDLLVHAH